MRLLRSLKLLVHSRRYARKSRLPARSGTVHNSNIFKMPESKRSGKDARNFVPKTNWAPELRTLGLTILVSIYQVVNLPLNVVIYSLWSQQYKYCSRAQVYFQILLVICSVVVFRVDILDSVPDWHGVLHNDRF